ncbi:hypothetical protein BaRGS_00007897, partial [Batillaria attramentaria]
MVAVRAAHAPAVPHASNYMSLRLSAIFLKDNAAAFIFVRPLDVHTLVAQRHVQGGNLRRADESRCHPLDETNIPPPVIVKLGRLSSLLSALNLANLGRSREVKSEEEAARAKSLDALGICHVFTTVPSFDRNRRTSMPVFQYWQKTRREKGLDWHHPSSSNYDPCIQCSAKLSSRDPLFARITSGLNSVASNHKSTRHIFIQNPHKKPFQPLDLHPPDSLPPSTLWWFENIISVSIFIFLSHKFYKSPFQTLDLHSSVSPPRSILSCFANSISVSLLPSLLVISRIEHLPYHPRPLTFPTHFTLPTPTTLMCPSQDRCKGEASKPPMTSAAD